MSIVIELPPEIEASLAEQAAAQGISLPQYLHRLLESQVSLPAKLANAAERANFWRQSVQGLPRTPPLSDRAIARETIYDTRG